MDFHAPIPREPVAPVKGGFPKTLEEFARKHTDQVEALAAQGLDTQSQAALTRTLKDLGLESTGDVKTDLLGLHKSLRTYRDAINEIKAAAFFKASAPPELAESAPFTAMLLT